MNEKSNIEEIILEIKVIPGAKNKAIKWDAEQGWRIYLNTPPVDGKANKECLKYLAKTLKIAKSKIIIIKGELNRHKKIKILGLSINEVETRLKNV